MNFTDINASIDGFTLASTTANDFDNDGDIDILVTGSTQPNVDHLNTAIYFNDGSGNFTENNLSIPGVYSGSVVSSDFDGDGSADIFITGFHKTSPTSTTIISDIYTNNGAGVFSKDTTVNLPAAIQGSVITSDYDQDGDQDLLLSGLSQNGRISKIYDNDGNGNFTENTNAFIPAVHGGSLATEDFDGDNDIDILLTGHNQQTNQSIAKIFRNNGNNEFSENTNVNLTGMYRGSVAAGDFDGDDDIDIILTGDSNQGTPTTIVYNNDGNGNFSENTNVSLNPIFNGSIAAADFDNDNDLDIFLAGYDGNRVTKIYINDGAGNFVEDLDKSDSIAEISPSRSSVAIADYDNDNKLDIFLAGYDGNDSIAKIYRNDIQTSFNQISGTSGNDSLNGTIANDSIDGGAGRDTLKGNAGNDILNGEADTDYLYGEAGNDTLNGGGSKDYFYPGAGNDSIVGGDDYDYLIETSNGNLVLTDSQLSTTEAGTDSISEIERAYLYGRNDNNLIDVSATTNITSKLYGYEGNDTLKGGDRQDLFYPAAGNDSIVGGGGYDILYETSNGSLILTNSQLTTSEAGTDSISEIELIHLYGRNDNNLIDASAVNNVYGYLYGRDGDDTLKGGNSSHIFHPGAGNDSVVGGNYGYDQIQEHGGTGNTVVTNSQLITENFGTDSFSGIEQIRLSDSSSSSILDASTVSDFEVDLRGKNGNDTLKGGDLNDDLLGGAGDDFMTGGDGYDRFFGDDGDDRLIEISNGNLVLTNTSLTTPQTGTDSLNSIENATLNGRSDNNLINGSAVTNMKLTLKGNAGNDNLRGGSMDDELYGGIGNDTLTSNSGNDYINGGIGNDLLVESINSNIILTDTKLIGDGNNNIRLIERANLTGGKGNNLIDASSSTRIRTLIKGRDGNDVIKGGAKNDTLDGGNGNDTLLGHGGSDTFIGGDGIDSLYEKSDLDLTLTNNQLTGNGNDSLTGVEVVYLNGGGGDNSIDASGATQIKTFIFGDDGNDNLSGGAKTDVLEGGNGLDTLSGNDGADIFVLGLAAGRDLITDFEDGIDSFRLDVFSSFGSLNIYNNSSGTAAIIQDLSQDNQIIAVVQNVDASNITLEDFANI